MPIVASGPRFALRALPLLFLPLLGACAEDPRAAVLLDETPAQPIAFMHSVHVQDNQIPCAYCHSSSNASEEAGIPAVGTCMGCHRFVAGTTPEFQAEITKVLGMAADSTAIPWVRVHSVPTFVQFTHKPHVRAGVTCVECHGNVAGMVEVTRGAPLTMGWCVNCHRDRGAPDDCATCHF